MFEFMNVITLKAVFEARKPGRLPEYLGSTIRGVLGHCFREFVCDTPETKCFVCEKRGACSYVRHFSNTGGKGGAVNPYVIYSCTRGKTEWKAGDECGFELTLFGDAAANPQIYMDALIHMERKGWGSERLPFRLSRVTEKDTNRLIYAGGQTWLRNLTPHSMKIRQGKVRAALIFFDTPLRIVSGGKLFEQLPFQTFMRFLAGRFSLLTQVCTDFTMEWDTEEMLEQASRVKASAQCWRPVDFVRYSVNQKDSRLELPAQSGWVLYEGELSPFVPYLEAGRYLHAGKNTTLGFGHYEVFYDEEIGGE